MVRRATGREAGRRTIIHHAARTRTMKEEEKRRRKAEGKERKLSILPFLFPSLLVACRSSQGSIQGFGRKGGRKDGRTCLFFGFSLLALPLPSRSYVYTLMFYSRLLLPLFLSRLEQEEEDG